MTKTQKENSAEVSLESVFPCIVSEEKANNLFNLKKKFFIED